MPLLALSYWILCGTMSFTTVKRHDLIVLVFIASVRMKYTLTVHNRLISTGVCWILAVLQHPFCFQTPFLRINAKFKSTSLLTRLCLWLWSLWLIETHSQRYKEIQRNANSPFAWLSDKPQQRGAWWLINQWTGSLDWIIHPVPCL